MPSLHEPQPSTRTQGLDLVLGLRRSRGRTRGHRRGRRVPRRARLAGSSRATLTGEPEALAGLVHGAFDIDEAPAHRIQVEGDVEAVRQFAGIFVVPEKAF